MASEYIKDILLLRSEFNLIDKNDHTELKNWLAKHEYLSTNDLAQIANKSAAYIRRLKRKIGIVSNKSIRTAPIGTHIKKINSIVPPSNWDTKDWLTKAIRIYSINSIAQACGVSRRTIIRRLEKYEIPKFNRPLSTNKCCTWDWCNRYYTEMGWSQKKCADKAGICQQTFANWLNHFKIPVRNSNESIRSNLKVKLWVRKLKSQLDNLPIVRRTYLRKDHIHVRFTNYFWESYYFDTAQDKLPPYSYHINRHDAVINQIPKVYPEYEHQIDQNIITDNKIINQPHIIINRSDLDKSSFIESRLVLHEYCRQITQREWLQPTHPNIILNNEIKEISDDRDNRCTLNNMLSVYSNNKPTLGRKIMESFFDLSEYAQIFKSPKYTVRLLNILLKRKDLKFNFHNLLRLYTAGVVKLPSNYTTYKMFDPSVYLILYKKLNITNSVLDLNPGYGSKAIAASIDNLKYYTIGDTQFDMAVENGLADFLNLDHHKWDKDNVDLILLDNNFSLPNISSIKKYIKYGKRLVMYIPLSKKDIFKKQLSPKSIVPIHTKWYQSEPDCLFIW